MDKALNSLGYKFGYALPKSKLPNPINIVMVYAQKVTVLDLSGIEASLLLGLDIQFSQHFFNISGFSTRLLLVCGHCSLLSLLHHVWDQSNQHPLLLDQSILLCLSFHILQHTIVKLILHTNETFSDLDSQFKAL